MAIRLFLISANGADTEQPLIRLLYYLKIPIICFQRISGAIGGVMIC